MNSINIINILGVYPPPLGGVSIHVKRLIHGLNLSLIHISEPTRP